MAKATLREQLDEKQTECDELLADLRDFAEQVYKHHQAEHPEVFRYCPNTVCKYTVELEDAYGW